jgi:hypothetical protein
MRCDIPGPKTCGLSPSRRQMVRPKSCARMRRSIRRDRPSVERGRNGDKQRIHPRVSLKNLRKAVTVGYLSWGQFDSPRAHRVSE